MNLAINYESYLAQVKFCGNCINDSKMGKRAKTKQITVLQIAGFHGTLKALLVLQLQVGILYYFLSNNISGSCLWAIVNTFFSF